ncbi:MFS transporter [Streptomyces griseocarneus]|nr:MFS transporter [Streptomyces griseocarneus]
METHIAPTPAPGKGLGRDFGYLWSAGLIAPLGDGALVAALPLAAKSLTDDPRLISGVAFAATLPWLLLSVVGGALVDRMDRRRLMLGAQITQAALVALIAILVTSGLTQIWMLFLLPFGVASAEVLFTTAGQTVIAAVVPEEHLEKANGRLVATETVAKEFAGPPLGAALFAFATPLPFWLNSVTFALSVLLTARIRIPAREPRPATGEKLSAEIAAGLRWLLRHRLLRTLSLVAGAAMFCEAMALSTLVLFAHDELHIGDRGYGVLLAAMAVGGVVGGIIGGRVVGRLGGRVTAIGAQSACSLMWLAIGLVGRSPVTVVALFTVFSVSVSLWVVVVQSVRQRLVPGELLGRVSGAARMLTWGAMPLGALVGGFVADSFGLVSPWLVGGTLSLLVTLIALPALLRWDR